MRAKSLVILGCFLVLSACASLPLKREKFHVIEKYSVVSMDMSVCGKTGTMMLDGEMELRGNRFDKYNYIVLSARDPIANNEVFRFKSEFFYYSGYIAFRLGDLLPRMELIGKLRVEEKSDGEYLVINFPGDQESIEREEEELKRLEEKISSDLDKRSLKGYLRLVNEQQEKLERLKRGFDWVFKKKEVR